MGHTGVGWGGVRWVIPGGGRGGVRWVIQGWGGVEHAVKQPKN